jgi:hypothetical protein
MQLHAGTKSRVCGAAMLRCSCVQCSACEAKGHSSASTSPVVEEVATYLLPLTSWSCLALPHKAQGPSQPAGGQHKKTISPSGHSVLRVRSFHSSNPISERTGICQSWIRLRSNSKAVHHSSLVTRHKSAFVAQ